MQINQNDFNFKLEQFYDSIKRIESKISLSIPEVDDGGHFEDLMKCFHELAKSRMKYIRKLKAYINSTAYQEEMNNKLGKALNTSSKDIKNKAVIKIIDDHMLNLVRKQMNIYGDIYVGKKIGIQLLRMKIPKRKKNEDRKTYISTINKALKRLVKFEGGRYRHLPGTLEGRIYFIHNTLAVFDSPIENFPEYIHSQRNEIPIQRNVESGIGLFDIIMKITKRKKIELSKEFFKVNQVVFDEIDKILSTHKHQDININDSIQFSHTLVNGFTEYLDHMQSSRRSLNKKKNLKRFLKRDDSFSSALEEKIWTRDCNYQLGNINIDTVRLFVSLFYEMDYTRNIGGFDPISVSSRIFESYNFNSFIDGFGGSDSGSENTEKLRAANIEVVNKTIDNFASFLNDFDGRKGLSLIDWLNQELLAFYSSTFADEEQDKYKQDFENLLPETIKNKCVEMLFYFNEHKETVTSLSEEIGSEDLHTDAEYYHEKPIRHFYELNPTKYSLSMYKFLSRSYSEEKLIELQRSIDSNDFEVMRLWLTLEEEDFGKIQNDIGIFNKSDLNKKTVPRKKFIPSELFKLRQTFKKSFNNEVVENITYMLNTIEQNPSTLDIFMIRLTIEMEKAASKKRNNIKENFQMKYWQSILNFMKLKKVSMVDTHLYSIINSLIRVLLFIEGIYPYSGIKHHRNVYYLCSRELKKLIDFFEHYLHVLTENRHFACPINKKIFIYELLGNFRSLKKYLDLIEIHGTYDKNREVFLENKSISHEDLYQLSRRKKNKKQIEINDLFYDQFCKTNYLHNDYQKFAFIRKETLSDKSVLRRCKAKKGFLERESAIKWLKTRPGTRKLNELTYSLDLKKDITILDFL